MSLFSWANSLHIAWSQDVTRYWLLGSAETTRTQPGVCLWHLTENKIMNNLFEYFYVQQAKFFIYLCFNRERTESSPPWSCLINRLDNMGWRRLLLRYFLHNWRQSPESEVEECYYVHKCCIKVNLMHLCTMHSSASFWLSGPISALYFL